MAPTPLLLPLAVPLHADPENQPPPLTPESALTGWTPDPWVVAALVLMVGLYLWGVRRLAVRGIRWPVGRTIAWCVGGAGVIALALLSFLGTYDTVLFSVHMVQHIMLSMVGPIMMAMGAPITLLLRNLGGLGRRRVMRVLHSWPVRVLTWAPLDLTKPEDATTVAELQAIRRLFEPAEDTVILAGNGHSAVIKTVHADLPAAVCEISDQIRIEVIVSGPDGGSTLPGSERQVPS